MIRLKRCVINKPVVVDYLPRGHFEITSSEKGNDYQIFIAVDQECTSSDIDIRKDISGRCAGAIEWFFGKHTIRMRNCIVTGKTYLSFNITIRGLDILLLQVK